MSTNQLKEAIVVIHGIGEQKPMDTIRAFADAVIEDDGTGKEKYWSKPDPMSDLFELRKLKTPGRTKTEFFEYYWAYNVEGTKYWHLFEWLFGLIVRKKDDVPPTLRTLWRLSRAIVLLLLVLIVTGWLSRMNTDVSSLARFSPTWFLWGSLLLAIQYALINYVGDAARYLSSNPKNISLRQKIRSEGVKLLELLHRSGEYDRIVIVGHSLGSVIAYDIITRLWQKYHTQYSGLDEADEAIYDKLKVGDRVQPIIRDELPDAGEKLTDSDDGKSLLNFQQLQNKAFEEHRSLGNPWLITDLITLGCPLAHAMMLLASSRKEFEDRKKQRELPTCPPVLDEKGYSYSSGGKCYAIKDKKFTPLFLHHAAPFAVTRWTNIYFPAYLGLFGDFVGGPMRPVFGKGIRDIPVTTSRWNGIARFIPGVPHVMYWDSRHDGGRGSSLAFLRQALDIQKNRRKHRHPHPKQLGYVEDPEAENSDSPQS